MPDVHLRSTMQNKWCMKIGEKVCIMLAHYKVTNQLKKSPSLKERS